MLWVSCDIIKIEEDLVHPPKLYFQHAQPMLCAVGGNDIVIVAREVLSLIFDHFQRNVITQEVVSIQQAGHDFVNLHLHKSGRCPPALHFGSGHRSFRASVHVSACHMHVM